MMACINPVQQYQWKISDLFDSFLNSMKDSRARVEVDSQRHEGLCIVKLLYGSVEVVLSISICSGLCSTCEDSTILPIWKDIWIL